MLALAQSEARSQKECSAGVSPAVAGASRSRAQQIRRPLPREVHGNRKMARAEPALSAAKGCPSRRRGRRDARATSRTDSTLSVIFAHECVFCVILRILT